jgi:hypothetical protein
MMRRVGAETLLLTADKTVLQCNLELLTRAKAETDMPALRSSPFRRSRIRLECPRLIELLIHVAVAGHSLNDSLQFAPRSMCWTSFESLKCISPFPLLLTRSYHHIQSFEIVSVSLLVHYPLRPNPVVFSHCETPYVYVPR